MLGVGNYAHNLCKRGATFCENAIPSSTISTGCACKAPFTVQLGMTGIAEGITQQNSAAAPSAVAGFTKATAQITGKSERSVGEIADRNVNSRIGLCYATDQRADKVDGASS
jgi:hypothetical protein